MLHYSLNMILTSSTKLILSLLVFCSIYILVSGIHPVDGIHHAVEAIFAGIKVQ